MQNDVLHVKLMEFCRLNERRLLKLASLLDTDLHLDIFYGPKNLHSGFDDINICELVIMIKELINVLNLLVVPKYQCLLF